MTAPFSALAAAFGGSGTSGEELSFVRGLESNLGKAFQLANGAAIHGDPGHYRTEYQKTLAVTAADVQRVVDEAYREFVRSEDPVDAVERYGDRPNVVVMRTFAKAYGLAGFRVGYAVAPEPIAAAVRACALPFGVSSIAQAAAIASLEREAELLERVDGIVAERTRVVGALRDKGWDVPDAQGNFVWLALGNRTAEFAAAAEEAGIMVRPFAGEGARVSIGEPAGNDVFLEVASRFAP